jgi:hypothetical protein
MAIPACCCGPDSEFFRFFVDPSGKGRAAERQIVVKPSVPVPSTTAAPAPALQPAKPRRVGGRRVWSAWMSDFLVALGLVLF